MQTDYECNRITPSPIQRDLKCRLSQTKTQTVVAHPTDFYSAKQ